MLRMGTRATLYAYRLTRSLLPVFFALRAPLRQTSGVSDKERIVEA